MGLLTMKWKNRNKSNEVYETAASRIQLTEKAQKLQVDNKNQKH
jgi:hypothetical protein